MAPSRPYDRLMPEFGSIGLQSDLEERVARTLHLVYLLHLAERGDEKSGDVAVSAVSRQRAVAFVQVLDEDGVRAGAPPIVRAQRPALLAALAEQSRRDQDRQLAKPSIHDDDRAYAVVRLLERIGLIET
jgi:hypothetical protein